MELRCFLQAMALPESIEAQTLGGGRFLTFDAPELTDEQLSTLGSHSALCFFAKVQEGALLPVDPQKTSYLPDDLSQVLKYKGKTNVEFTRMMINCALCASDQLTSQRPITLLDPVAGRGTTLLCALERGFSAFGVDSDDKAVKECEQYFERYLQYHRIKHRKEQCGKTLGGGKSARATTFTLAGSPEDYKRGDTRTLTLCAADTKISDKLTGKNACDLIVGDLPYGVQHAPKDQDRMSEMETMLKRALPAYLCALRPGGAIALSFNTYTLKRAVVQELMDTAGFHPLTQPPYDNFEHWVEQAVSRDFVIAVR